MPLQRKTQCLRQNLVAKAAKAVNRQTIAKSVAFCSFVPLQRKTQCLRQNLVAKAAKAVNRQTTAKSVAFCSFVPLQRKTQCLRQNLVAKAAKTVMSTERSEWRHLEAVANVRGIFLPKDFHA